MMINYTFSSKFSINLDYDQSVETDKKTVQWPVQFVYHNIY